MAQFNIDQLTGSFVENATKATQQLVNYLGPISPSAGSRDCFFFFFSFLVVSVAAKYKRQCLTDIVYNRISKHNANAQNENAM